MSAIYNMDLALRLEESKLSPENKEKTIEVFSNAGLIGEKHVNNFGKLINGYDLSCSVYFTGKFDIFIRNSPEFREKTIRENLEYQKLITSGFDKPLQKMFALGDIWIDLLEKSDPLAKDLPVEMYFSLPHIETFALNTPCGRQQTHVHTENDIIQFWRPKNSSNWYDYDYIKGVLFDAVFNYAGLEDNSLTEKIKFTKSRVAGKLYKQLMQNPDEFNKYKLLLIKFLKQK